MEHRVLHFLEFYLLLTLVEVFAQAVVALLALHQGPWVVPSRAVAQLCELKSVEPRQQCDRDDVQDVSGVHEENMHPEDGKLSRSDRGGPFLASPVPIGMQWMLSPALLANLCLSLKYLWL